MSISKKSESKYLCKNRELLKNIMKDEGFIFKNSSLQIDEYFIDLNRKVLESDTCIRIRIINNKELVLSFCGSVDSISSLDIKDNQKVLSDISQYDNIVSFLADLGYYKYLSVNLLKETYVKKEKEYYYSIGIDTIENVGNFIYYNIYTDFEDVQKLNTVFNNFENKLKECCGQEVNNEYRDFSSYALYNNMLKGDYLKRILVETDKIFKDININNINDVIRDKYTILNLELIEKLEHLGIEVKIVYSNTDYEIIENLRSELNKIGYTPTFMDIKEIKEIAVRETLIIEKQKRIDFCEVALMVINNRKKENDYE